jgi:hypothetical protein
MTKDRAGLDRWDDEGGALRTPEVSAGSPFPPDPPKRVDHTNPLLDPATSMRHAFEDAQLQSPCDRKNPGGSRTGPDADADC